MRALPWHPRQQLDLRMGREKVVIHVRELTYVNITGAF